MWYNSNKMKRDSLIKTNPYLGDKTTYEKRLFVNVSTSATIELGKLSPSILRALKSKQPTLIYLSPEIEKEFSR